MRGKSFKQIFFVLIRKNPLYAIQLLAGMIGIVFVLNFGYETALYGYLSAFGEPAQATVTAVDRMRVSNTWRYYLDVSYRDETGVPHSGRRFVLSSAYKTGETLTVRYVRHVPELFIMEDELASPRYVRNSGIMLAIGLILSVFCVPRMIFFMRLTGNIRCLLRNGRNVSGKILEIKNRHYKLGNHIPKYLIYHFTDSRGRQRTVESITLPKDREENIAKSATIPVLIDPTDPDGYFADVMGFLEP